MIATCYVSLECYIVHDIFVVCVLYSCLRIFCVLCFFFQAEDGIRDLVRSRGLGDVYKRQAQMAMFVVLPRALVDHGGLAPQEHWKVYLPAVLALSLIHI